MPGTFGVSSCLQPGRVAPPSPPPFVEFDDERKPGAVVQITCRPENFGSRKQGTLFNLLLQLALFEVALVRLIPGWQVGRTVAALALTISAL